MIAHELFHTIQLATWQPANLSDYWLLEGSAEWMGYRVDGYNTRSAAAPPSARRTCRSTAATRSARTCATSDDYANNGYSRWPFFEYLTEKYGLAFVQDIFAQRRARGAHDRDSPQSRTRSSRRGTTLADTYNAWTQADLIGGYSVSALQDRQPPSTSPGRPGQGGDLGKTLVTVNHLSTRTSSSRAATVTPRTSVTQRR